jgi:hypothetical protein
MSRRHPRKPLAGCSRHGVLLALIGVLTAAGCGNNNPEKPAPIQSSADLHGIGGWTEFDLFAVGDRGTIFRYNGSVHSFPSPTTRDLHGVVGFSASSAIAVGEAGTILNYDGSAFSIAASPTSATLRGLWGSSESNLIAVGDGGTIIENDGSGWTKATSPTGADLRGVWALGSGEAYAVGVGGSVAHRSGGAWTLETGFTGADLNSVWADKPRDWFAVGDGGEIWQNRGSGWMPMSSPRSGDLLVVAGSDSAFVFAAGAIDSVLFYDQLEWTPIAPNPTKRLEGIWATVCPLSPVASSGAAALHCSNTYLAGSSEAMARYTLIGTYEILHAPR